VRWTLLVPLQIARTGENHHPFTAEVLMEAAPLFLGVLAFPLLQRALPSRQVLHSPLPWLALGCLGMAYPRAHLLRLSACLAISAVLMCRSFLLCRALLLRGRRSSPPPGRLLLFSFGAAAALCCIAVALLGGGPLLVWRLGGPAYYWDDPHSRRYEAVARERVRPGDDLVIFGAPNETLYVRLQAQMPERIYVNTSFAEFLTKEGVDGRVVSMLRRHPDALLLFQDTEDPALRATELYRFIVTRTRVVGEAEAAQWRLVGRLP
jgi:hypothetical protein